MNSQTLPLQQLTDSFVALMLSVFLLAVPPAGYQVIADFKYGLFVVICGGYVALALILNAQLMIVGVRKPQNPLALLKGMHVQTKLLAAFLLFVIVSAILSEYDGVLIGSFRREGLLTLAIYVLMTLLVSDFVRPAAWMLCVFAVSMMIFCVLCIIQLTGANPFSLYPPGHNFYGAYLHYSGEYIGTIGNTNLCASVLCISAAVFAMAIIRFTGWLKWFFSVPLCLTVFVLWELNVEAGIVGFLGGFLLMIPVAARNAVTLRRAMTVIAIAIISIAVSSMTVFGERGVSLAVSRRCIIEIVVSVLLILVAVALGKTACLHNVPEYAFRRAAVAFVVFVAVSAVAGLWFYGGGGGFVYEAHELLHGRWNDAFGSNRLYIWRNILEGLDRRLLFGTGPDTVGYWDIQPFERYEETLGILIQADIDAAHNEYLQISACHGILALAAYLGTLAAAFAGWYSSTEDISAIAGAAALFYCIQAVFGIAVCITYPYFWIALAILLRTQKNKNQNVNSKEKIR
jgi:hypothetical protein